MNAHLRQMRETPATYGFAVSGWTSAAAGPPTHAEERAPQPPLSAERLVDLARGEPEELFHLVLEGDLSIPLLTFAAEALGQVPPAYYPQASHLLRRLLHHPHAVVREGAVYGIAGIAERSPTVLEFVRPLAGDREPSPGVRQAAAEVLDRNP